MPLKKSGASLPECHLPASLPEWRELLDGRLEAYEGKFSLGDDPALFADRLQALEAVFNNPIEQSIRAWIGTGNWTALSKDEDDCLLFRLVLAKVIVVGLVENNEAGLVHVCGPPPELPDNRRAFAEWLLIKCWNHLSDSWLERCAASFLNKDFSGSAEWGS